MTFYGWAGVAWPKLWVYLESVSDRLALLVLLQIGAKEITGKLQNMLYSWNLQLTLVCCNIGFALIFSNFWGKMCLPKIMRVYVFLWSFNDVKGLSLPVELCLSLEKASLGLLIISVGCHF